jgi:WD40 repeat protein
MTASFDSTIRIWTFADTKKQKYVIPVKSKMPGARTPITAACMTHDGRSILGVGEDGVIRLWPATGPFVMPTMVRILYHSYVSH